MMNWEVLVNLLISLDAMNIDFTILVVVVVIVIIVWIFIIANKCDCLLVVITASMNEFCYSFIDGETLCYILFDDCDEVILIDTIEGICCCCIK